MASTETGFDGGRIRDVVCEVIGRLGRATGFEIFTEAAKVGKWGEHHLRRHIMGLIVNLQLGYHEWPFIRAEEKCLFMREDGYLEKYDQKLHGKFADGVRI
ncbi:MAG: hypothetical protein ACM3ON_06575 [Chloroflexota bacterium]